jgi:ascorbate-specific PTS system EIIC-type component UlaA
MTVLGRRLPTGHHLMHYLCAVACVVLIVSIVVGFLPLVVLGAVFCGAMMVGMVWMMASMLVRRR